MWIVYVIFRKNSGPLYLKRVIQEYGIKLSRSIFVLKFLDGDLDQQFESTKMSTGILSAHEPHKAVMIQAAISTFVRHLEGEKRDSSKN